MTKTKNLLQKSGILSVALFSILAASCSGGAKTETATEHKPDSLVITERRDTAYTPSDPKDPSSPLVGKVVVSKDTVRIKR